MARPSKGERVGILAKPAVPLAMVIKANATAAGLSYGEYMTALAAEALGMPEFAPQPPRNRANELPIDTEVEKTQAA